MENWIVFSVTFNIILFFWAVISTRNNISLISQNVLLKARIDDLILRGKLAAELMKESTSLLSKKPAHSFDQRTVSLIRLAARSSNENEARAAAVQACKRIDKTL
jgi:hypothetical protein